MQLPDGYDTLIGERGVKLSGGQKQPDAKPHHDCGVGGSRHQIGTHAELMARYGVYQRLFTVQRLSLSGR